MAFSVAVTGGVGSALNDKQVVQRTTLTGAKGFRCSGTFAGATTGRKRFEYRIVLDGTSTEVLTWTRGEIVGPTEGATGDWSVRVDSEIAMGGWYNWEFRVVSDTDAVLDTDASPTIKWGVGLNYLLIGQSNMEYFYLQGDATPGTADAKLGFVMSVGNVEVPWMDVAALDDHNFHVIGGAWTESSKTITQTGAFANYSFTASDAVYLYGTGITPGFYEIASRTSDDAIVLATSPSTAGTDLANTVNSQPRSGGLVAALNAVQAGVTNDTTNFGNIPIGAIGMAVSGSALVKGANPDALTNTWGDPDEEWTLTRRAIDRVNKLGLPYVEGVVFIQGESESRAYDVAGKVTLKAAYKQQLEELHLGLKKYLKGPNETEIKFVLGGPGRNLEFINTILSAPAINSSSIMEARLEYAFENDTGFVSAMDIPPELILDAAPGLHWTKAGQKTWGARLGIVLQAVTGIGAATAMSKRGPRISNAWTGWNGPIDIGGAVSKAAAAVITTPFNHGRDSGKTFKVVVSGTSGTDTDVNGIHVGTSTGATTFTIPVNTSGATGTYAGGNIEIIDGRTNKSVITLEIEHDQGTALTIGDDDSITCFTVQDEEGPLFVYDVAQVQSNQYLVLSLRRDTTQTENAVAIPYSAPDRLAGNYALVKYLDWCTLPHEGANKAFQIFDNATNSMPLLPTFGFVAPANTSLRDLPENEPDQLSIQITDVTSLATKIISVDAQDTPWLRILGNPIRMIKPGERFVVQAIGGPYVGEGTLEKVNSYTDDSTDVDLLLSHDMTDQAPSLTNYITFPYNTETACGICAGPRTADSFGV